MILVAIDNYTRQPIALAPDDAAKPQIDSTPLPVLQGLRDPALEKIEIEVLPPPGKSTGYDLRFAVVNGAADQVISSVFQRDDVTVGGSPKNLQDFAGKHPVVPVQDSGARFYNKTRHGKKVNGDRGIVNRELEFLSSVVKVGTSLFTCATRSYSLTQPPWNQKLRGGKVEGGSPVGDWR
jgi:hypothetical protein